MILDRLKKQKKSILISALFLYAIQLSIYFTIVNHFIEIERLNAESLIQIKDCSTVDQVSQENCMLNNEQTERLRTTSEGQALLAVLDKPRTVFNYGKADSLEHNAAYLDYLRVYMIDNGSDQDSLDNLDDIKEVTEVTIDQIWFSLYLYFLNPIPVFVTIALLFLIPALISRKKSNKGQYKSI